MVAALNSTADFDSTLTSNQIVVIDFYATWCGPCKGTIFAILFLFWATSPKFEELSHVYTTAKFIKVDVDVLSDVAQKCEIRAMPTFQVYRGGKKVGEVVGADIKKLEEVIKANL